MAASSSARSPRDSPRRGARRRDEPTLPEVTDDERETGWGDDLAADSGERDAEWYRRQRPPHHG